MLAELYVMNIFFFKYKARLKKTEKEQKLAVAMS